MQNQAAAPTPWLNGLLGAADRAVKRFLKRDIELGAYYQPYSGDGTRDIICRQYPVWVAQTQVAGASDGVSLPQATINVASTKGFHPGTGGNQNAQPPAVAIQVGPSSWTWVTYTGTTATSFTGCTLGGPLGVMKASYTKGVSSPVVFFDPGGYFAQAPQGLMGAPDNRTQMVMGSQFVVVTDGGSGAYGARSERGLIRRIGGAGAGFVGYYLESWYQGKLGGYRMPRWPRGDGNLFLCWTAGYGPPGSGLQPQVPDDIVWATAGLAAMLVRNLPYGGLLQSESLGSYSYALLHRTSTEIPGLGSIEGMLAPYRESSF